jgi:hypothetical protein
MNKKQRFNFKILLFFGLVFVACQQPDEYDIPTALGTEENEQLNTLLAAIEQGEKTLISIDQAKEYFVYRRVHTFASDLVLKGYVVSSDRTGNFYKEIYLQDAPQNPTAAIHIMLDQTKSYATFNMGREVYIDLNGLHVGESRRGNGIISIGGQLNSDGDEVEIIRSLDIPERIFRTKTTVEITALPVEFSQISNEHIGLFVMIDSVRVSAEEQGKPFADPRDYYDTQRTLVACEGDTTTAFLLETSTFATYKDHPMPSGTGSIQGIISKTYNGSDLVLTLNDVADAKLTGVGCGG